MSEPVSNTEVEDVVASIRRLVSEESRSATEGTGAEDVVGKFVLTPSLRVDADAPSEDAASGQSDATDLLESIPSAQMSEDDSADDQPDPQDVQAAENARMAAHLVKVLNGGAGSESAQTDEPEHVADGVDAPGTTAGSAAASKAMPPEDLSAKVAALEAAVARRDDEWEPDGIAEAEPYSGTDAPAFHWGDDTKTGVLGQTVTPGTALVSTTEPHDEGPARGQGTTGTGVPDVETAEPDAPLNVLDETTLKDLVAELVREELQGVLGERITRNVRKLVRQEIQRALTAKDLT